MCLVVVLLSLYSPVTHHGNPPPPPPTDQAVRGGRHGQKLHSGFPPRKVDACGSADARSSTDACLS